MLRKFCSVEASNSFVLWTVLFSVAEGTSGEICPTASLLGGEPVAVWGAGLVLGGVCFLALVTPLWCLFFGFGGNGFGIVVEASGNAGCVAAGFEGLSGVIVGGVG